MALSIYLSLSRTCTEVMEPLVVVVMRSCKAPKSVASVGWYPTADGMRPSRADTYVQKAASGGQRARSLLISSRGSK